jgi:hypothetical protein
VVHKDTMYVFGGSEDAVVFFDLYALDIGISISLSLSHTHSSTSLSLSRSLSLSLARLSLSLSLSPLSLTLASLSLASLSLARSLSLVFHHTTQQHNTTTTQHNILTHFFPTSFNNTYKKNECGCEHARMEHCQAHAECTLPWCGVIVCGYLK